MDSINRRKFIEASLGGVAAVAVAAAAYPLFRYLSPPDSRVDAEKVSVPEKEIPEGDVKFIQYAGSAAVLVHRKGGGVLALSAVCTHLGCIVQWRKERQDFLCPCHAGHFTAEGKVISGPPPKPLAPLPVSVANGIITVG